MKTLRDRLNSTLDTAEVGELDMKKLSRMQFRNKYWKMCHWEW